MTIVAYGSWPSPLSAAVAADRAVAGDVQIGGDGSVWWAESRPTEAGRTVVVCCRPGGEATDMVPDGRDVRSRVHEYGGAAWRLTSDGFVFSDARDGRLYVAVRADGEFVPLTPVPHVPHDDRFADMELMPGASAVVAVRERHRQAGVVRDLVLVPLDSSKAGDGCELDVVWQRSTFVAAPRVSPDGQALAFLAWDHLAMPWDRCELRVIDLGSGSCSRIGGPEEAMFQPAWTPDGQLLVASDRSGWWNLYRVAGEDLEPLCPIEEEIGEPAWAFGTTAYAVGSPDSVILRRGTDKHGLAILDLFGAAVSLCGVVDATRLVAETHDFESYYLDSLIGPLPEASQKYVERSPLSLVHQIRVPVLILQGLDDPIVPASQADAVVEALNANGIPHAYRRFPGERHGLRRSKNRVAALEAELSFYGQIFGFDLPGVPKLPIW